MLRRYANLYVLEILELGYVIFFFFGRFLRIYRGVFSLINVMLNFIEFCKSTDLFYKKVIDNQYLF